MGRATGAVTRRRRLCIDRLEERALLSGLSSTLTTDQSSYQVGQPIETYSGPYVDNEFVVKENGATIWESTPPLQDDVANFVWPMSLGEALSLGFAKETTLAPGQSLTETATWNGVSNEAQPPVLTGGSFTVSNLAVTSAPAASFQIDSPVSYSTSTDQSFYSVGQPIQIMYTETNITGQPVTVSTVPSDFAITQYGSGPLVANVPGSWGVSSDTETLKPGQSISETATWNGIASVGSIAGENVWNGLTISNPIAPEAVTAVVTIFNPLVSNFTATSPSFAAGRPITLTYSATNSSNVAVTVFDAPGNFSIQEAALPPFAQDADGNTAQDITVFSQTGPSGSLVTLQPGQSLTQTVTWTPEGGQAPIGTYNAYFSSADEWGVPWDGTAQFQVGSPSSISTTFTTNQADYNVGQPVQITLSETNTSNAPVTVYAGPLDFQISLVPDWLPGAGGTQSYADTLEPGYVAGILPGDPVAILSASGGAQSSTVILQPGHSFSETATWNGVANVGTSPGITPGTTPSGTLFVTLQNASTAGAVLFKIGSPNAPPSDVSLPSAVVTSLETAKPTVRPGQPMAITLALTNDSTKRVAVTRGKSTNTIAIYSGSELAWQSRKLALKGKKGIAAGRSIKLRGIVRVSTRAVAASRLAPGSYLLEFSYDGFRASQTIRITS